MALRLKPFVTAALKVLRKAVVPLLLGGTAMLRAADTSVPPAKPADTPEQRRPFLSREEREARFKEMQERFGPPPFSMEELRKMTPEERQAKLREWREQGMGRRGFTLEERRKRRQQIRARLTRQIAELQKKKADGKITEEEQTRLERLEMIASRFDRLPKPPPNAALPNRPSPAPSTNASP